MSTVIKEITNGVATLTFNRPEKLNAFNREMALELQQQLDQCQQDASIRAVLITGAGKGFSAGQDLAEVIDPKGPGLELILSEQFNPIILKIKKLQKPVVAAVNGVAAGAGANIALSCDIVIATASASFIQAFSKIGLIPDSGGTYFLPRLIGWQKASALMMLGDKLSAADAERIGMIYKVYDDEHFKEASVQLVTALAQLPTRALALSKQALQKSADNGLEDQLTLEDQLQAAAGATADYAEGVKAFIEKRQPRFTGR